MKSCIHNNHKCDELIKIEQLLKCRRERIYLGKIMIDKCKKTCECRLDEDWCKECKCYRKIIKVEHCEYEEIAHILSCGHVNYCY